jgi:hypothetical protein
MISRKASKPARFDSLLGTLAAWWEIPSFSGRSRVGIDEAMPSIWLVLRTLTFLDTDSLRTLHLKNKNL